MRKLFAAIAAAAALNAAAQTRNIVQEVALAAPHLVALAGSPANFRNLVVGLVQGSTITLATPLGNGLAETASFAASGTQSASEVVATLERARQNLAAAQIAQPTASQLGRALVGGTFDTPVSPITLPPALPAPGAVAGLQSQTVFVGVAPGPIVTPAPPGTTLTPQAGAGQPIVTPLPGGTGPSPPP
jgi:hypothetical protein